MSRRAKIAGLSILALGVLVCIITVWAILANGALTYLSGLLPLGGPIRIVAEPGQGTARSCLPLPKSFTPSDLVGTWEAEYFGGLAKDKLEIESDGTYKQVYTSSVKGFETNSNAWHFEFDKDGYGFLHLEGMRRCDDIEAICDNPGGGLPAGEMAVNQCKQELFHYSGEVVLLVVGDRQSPRGIELEQARLAGSDWFYSFQLQSIR